MVLVIHVALLLLLIAFVSLGVDWGRVQLAKTQLQRAADAAARAAAANISGGTTVSQNSAVSYAAQNLVNGTATTLNPVADFDFGTWDTSTRQFTVCSQAAANAVRIRLSRTAAKGNAIPLVFAQLLGQSTCDVHVQVVARVKPGGYGIVGLNFISMSGNSSDSYWSPTGYVAGGQHGAIASNGNITLSGSSQISGDAHPGIGMSVNNPGKVSGSTTPLTTTLSYPNGNPGSYATVNDDGLCTDINSSSHDLNVAGNHTSTMPAGTYYVHNFNFGNNATLNVTGIATMYVTGTFNCSGNILTSANKPANLTIIMCSTNAFSLSSNTAAYINLYAPQSAVTLGGTGDIYGSVVGLSVSMTGTSAIHYDTSLPGGVGGIETTQ